ncbi:MAG TPA: hypothetical protein VF411_00685 [Bacteroidia bacterium]
MATTPNLEGTLAEFNTSITTVVNCLNVDQAILGITNANLTDLNTLYTNPNAPGVTTIDDLGWIELWALHGNDNTKTKTVNLLVRTRRAELKSAVSNICGDIPQSVLSQDHRVALNWPKNKSTKTKHREGTKNLVRYNSTGLGGGDVQTKCFPDGAATNNPLATHKTLRKKHRNKPYKEEGYDIRRSFILIKQGAEQPTEPNAAGMTMEVITKANSVKHYGTANAGMVLCEFMQWYNSKHPELASPWSTVRTTLIT